MMFVPLLAAMAVMTTDIRLFLKRKFTISLLVSLLVIGYVCQRLEPRKSEHVHIMWR